MCDTAPCTPGLVVRCGGKTAACVWWWCWYVAAPDTAPPDIGADLELALALTSIRHTGDREPVIGMPPPYWGVSTVHCLGWVYNLSGSGVRDYSPEYQG